MDSQLEYFFKGHGRLLWYLHRDRYIYVFYFNRNPFDSYQNTHQPASIINHTI